MPKSSKSKKKKQSVKVKKTAHQTSDWGRIMASQSQIERRTAYKPRVNKAGNRSVMVGEKYGVRQGLDYYGKRGNARVYVSKYRGEKVGYIDDVPRGGY